MKQLYTVSLYGRPDYHRELMNIHGLVENLDQFKIYAKEVFNVDIENTPLNTTDYERMSCGYELGGKDELELVMEPVMYLF